jgi:hypothetical protein
MTRPDQVSESVRLRRQATEIRESMGKVLLELIAARAAAQRVAGELERGPDRADDGPVRPSETLVPGLLGRRG